MYELLSQFILNKIYLGKNATEKVLVINTIVEQMDVESMNYRVEKNAINDLLKQYSQAYQELLSIGVIKEFNEEGIYIAFNNNFLEHSLAKKLFFTYDNKFETELIEHVNNLFLASPYKLSVLKWCMVFAIKTDQQDKLENLRHLKLSSAEKAELIMFLNDLLKGEISKINKNEALLKYFKQEFTEKASEFFFG